MLFLPFFIVQRLPGMYTYYIIYIVPFLPLYWLLTDQKCKHIADKKSFMRHNFVQKLYLKHANLEIREHSSIFDGCRNCVLNQPRNYKIKKILNCHYSYTQQLV